MLKNSMLFVAIFAVTVSFTSRASAQTPKEITEGELQTRTNEIVVARKTLADNMSAQTTADSDLTSKKKRLESVEAGLNEVAEAKNAYDTAFEAKKTAENEWEAGRRAAATGATVPGLEVAEADARRTLAELENADESLRETIKKVRAKLKLSTFTLGQPITVLLAGEAITKLTEEKNNAQTAVDEAQTAATNAATAVSTSDTNLKELQRNFLLELGPTVYQREVIARQREQLAVQQALLKKLVKAALKPTPATSPVTNLNVDFKIPKQLQEEITALKSEITRIANAAESQVTATQELKTAVLTEKELRRAELASAIQRVLSEINKLDEKAAAEFADLHLLMQVGDADLQSAIDRLTAALDGLQTNPAIAKQALRLLLRDCVHGN